MKKKVKLFVTIASFCLAISMLAFGVYAASSVSYTVSGTLTYTVSNALVGVSTQMYILDPNVKHTESSVVSAGDSAWQTFGKAQTWFSYDTSTNVINSEEGFANLQTLQFNTSFAYKIVVTISTINKTGTVTAAPVPITNKPVNTFIVSPTAGVVTISKPLDLVYYIGLDDATTNASGNFSLPINILFDAK